MGDKWGVTHCAACGKQAVYTDELIQNEYDDRRKRDGADAAEEWSEAYCWLASEDECVENSASGNVTDVLVMLRERIDELEAQVQALKDEAEERLELAAEYARGEDN